MVSIALALGAPGCGARTGMLLDEAAPEPSAPGAVGSAGQAGSGHAGAAGQAGVGPAGAAGQAGVGQAGAGGQAGAEQAGAAGQAAGGQAAGGQAAGGSSSAQPTLDGTWQGPLTTSANPSQAPVMQFHTRKSGKVLGYVMGGAWWREITSAHVSGTSLTLTASFSDNLPAKVFTVDGTFDATSFAGTSQGQGSSKAVAWKRVESPIEERRVVLFTGPPSSPAHRVDVGLLLGESGLVSGSYHTVTSSCELISCGGRVLSFSETTAADGSLSLTIGYRYTENGNCDVDGTITASAPAGSPSPLFQGSYQELDCKGAPKGSPLTAAYAGRTTSAQVAGMLATLGRLADDQEAGASFASPYPPVSSAYLYNGLIADELLSALSLEVATYQNIDVDIDSISALSAGGWQLENAAFALPAGAVYHERRQGSKAGVVEVFRDVKSDVEPSLRYLREESGVWRFIGNQAP